MSATQAESVYGDPTTGRKSFSPDYIGSYERDRSPFSSNNPFRSGSVGSVRSSNGGDDEDIGNNRGPYVPRSNREYSLSDMSLPSSRNTSTDSSDYTSVIKNSSGLDDYLKPLGDGITFNIPDFRRRNYTPPSRSTSNRKSTNPFIDDSVELEKESHSNRHRSRSNREAYSERRDHGSSRTRHHIYESSSASRRSQAERNISSVPPVRRTNSSPHTMSGSAATHRREAPPPPKDADRHKSRRHRHSSKDKSHKEPKKIPAAGLDVIDKLDVTGFYGPGRFHHDGPFDACTPARNKNTKIAPVDAFPLNSANNSMALGSGPGFSTEDRMFGRDTTEAYLDYNWTSKKEGTSFDPHAKAQPVHGDTTMGLGSTTFLDGAPAPRSVSKSEEHEGASGLGRKKSLVQRLRGNGSKSPPARGEVTYEPISRYSSYPEPGSPQAGGGRNETKTRQIPEPTRRVAPEAPAKESGLIRRVKSLKVGRSRH